LATARVKRREMLESSLRPTSIVSETLSARREASDVVLFFICILLRIEHALDANT
jgi:hypothetical protein